MRAVYESEENYLFIDETSSEILNEARHWYKYYNLSAVKFLPYEDKILVFTWFGSKVNNTVSLMLVSEEIKATVHDMGVTVQDTTVEELKRKLAYIISRQSLPAETLSSFCKNKAIEKHDIFLSEDLLCKNYASRYLDAEKAYMAIDYLLSDNQR